MTTAVVEYNTTGARGVTSDLQLSPYLATKVCNVVPPTDITEAAGQRTKVNLGTSYVAVLLFIRLVLTPNLKLETLRLQTDSKV